MTAYTPTPEIVPAPFRGSPFMTALRFLTLIWPGLPWLWLRGSLSGLALAVAFAVAVDVAIVVTWIWPGLVELPLTIGLWTAVAALWLVATVSAVSGFPPPIPVGRGAEADALFAKARDLYLSRDWLQAESRLREAQKLGFDRALTPPLTVRHKGVGVTSVTRLAEAVERISQNRY